MIKWIISFYRTAIYSFQKHTTQSFSHKNTKFKTFKIFSLLHISIPIGMILILIFALRNHTQGVNIIENGDSLVTELIVEKELDSKFSTSTIQTKQELQQLSKVKPLSFVFYRVRPGENLYSVAAKFGLSMATVLSLNSLDNAHSISVGQKILLSTRSGILYNSTNDESVQDIANRYEISAKETSLVNALTKNHIEAGETLFLPNANLSFKAMAKILGFQFINPVPGYRRISSHFGWRMHPILHIRRLHSGIDFAARTGTPVRAAREGRVIYAGWSGANGFLIKIRHNNGFSTAYAHLSKVRVQSNTWVKAGDRIGDVGTTGRSTGPHLHFEIQKYNQPKNPIYNGLQL